jgi:hypothetical protein
MAIIEVLPAMIANQAAKELVDGAATSLFGP